ncbi:CbiQ family ECF transporter T component [Calidifontibacter terrae]
MGGAASQTTNPVLLAVVLAVVVLVVAARRPDAPWARSFRLYAYLGLFVIATRVVLFVLVGAKVGDTVLFRLPTINLPSWAAGIQLLGPVPLAGLAAAACEGLRLATMLTCFGAANVLANPRRLLRALPSALRDVGTAVVVALTVVPQLVQSIQRVRRARELRGTTTGGLHALRVIGLPVLQDTLDRSLALAAAMDSRGFGTRHAISARDRRMVAAFDLVGLFAVCLGVYGLLDSGQTPAVIGLPMVALGVVLGIAGLLLGGRKVPRSTYRPDLWAVAEWVVVCCGLIGLAAMIFALRQDPSAASMPVDPIGIPKVPLVVAGALLIAALPGFVTPELPAPVDRRTIRTASEPA